MIGVINSPQTPPADSARPQQPEAREAGENAVREFSQAMKGNAAQTNETREHRSWETKRSPKDGGTAPQESGAQRTSLRESAGEPSPNMAALTRRQGEKPPSEGEPRQSRTQGDAPSPRDAQPQSRAASPREQGLQPQAPNREPGLEKEAALRPAGPTASLTVTRSRGEGAQPAMRQDGATPQPAARADRETPLAGEATPRLAGEATPRLAGEAGKNAEGPKLPAAPDQGNLSKKTAGQALDAERTPLPTPRNDAAPPQAAEQSALAQKAGEQVMAADRKTTGRGEKVATLSSDALLEERKGGQRPSELGAGKAARQAPESPFTGNLFSLSGRGEAVKKQGGKDEKQGEEAQIAPRGEAILANIAPPKETTPVAAPAAVDAPRLDADTTTKLVDRILVSAADAKGNAEVRLSLREDVLPGTEIRIQRQPDGGVTVQFVTNDVRAEQMLGSRQLNDLQNTLAQSLNVEVRVSTVRTDGSMSADAGTGGQQEGGRQGGGAQDEQRDRRSRQHDLFEGLQEDQA